MLPTFMWTRGGLVEWLCSGLQIRVHRFDSGTRLHNMLYISPKKRHLKQDVVRKILYTIRTQNIGVDLAIPVLMFEGIS